MNWLNGVDLGIFNSSLPTLALVAYVAYQINGKFNKIKSDLENLLDSHEIKDQTRHLENLSRFTHIEVGQARMENNGKYDRFYTKKEKDDSQSS